MNALRARLPVSRYGCPQHGVGRHGGCRCRIEACVVVGLGGHGLDELGNLGIEQHLAAGVDALDLVAGVAVEPVGDRDGIVGAEQIDDQVVAALLEPQILVGYAAGEVNLAACMAIGDCRQKP
jgi:hypothetical protein